MQIEDPPFREKTWPPAKFNVPSARGAAVGSQAFAPEQQPSGGSLRVWLDRGKQGSAVRDGVQRSQKDGHAYMGVRTLP